MFNKMNYAKRTTPVKVHKDLYFDHKDIEVLNCFINQFGQIEHRHRSAMKADKPILREYQQKRLSKAIKRARYLALIPYMKDGEQDSDI